jgi:hypothetical protein
MKNPFFENLSQGLHFPHPLLNEGFSLEPFSAIRKATLLPLDPTRPNPETSRWNAGLGPLTFQRLRFYSGKYFLNPQRQMEKHARPLHW